MAQCTRAASTGFLAVLAAASALLVCTIGQASPVEGAPQWTSLAGEKTVFVLTADEDGEVRRTKIWLAVMDGQGYIRTSHSTRWGRNVVRDPAIVLESGGVEYPVLATFVEDPALRERVVTAFRAKYGWPDGLFQLFRGSNPHIMRLDARPPGE